MDHRFPPEVNASPSRMEDFLDIACSNFDFLCSNHGFCRSTPSSTRVRYESDKVFFDVTSHPRDGICVDFGRFGFPCELQPQDYERLSLNTRLGAIQTHQGTFQNEIFQTASCHDSASRRLQELSNGLRELGLGLINADENLYTLVRQLRFWHVGQWTDLWGTSIFMTQEEICRHRRLVPEILQLIEKRMT